MWVWDVDSIPTPHKNTGGFSYALPKKYTWYLLVTKCYPYCNPSQSCEHWLGWTLTAAEATSLDRPCDSRAHQSSSPVLTLWGITQRLVSGFRVVQNCTLRITFVVTSPNATYHCLIWNRLLTIDTDGKVFCFCGLNAHCQASDQATEDQQSRRQYSQLSDMWAWSSSCQKITAEVEIISALPSRITAKLRFLCFFRQQKVSSLSTIWRSQSQSIVICKRKICTFKM